MREDLKEIPSDSKVIAVYGGSFDPPHLGHAMVVSHLLLNEPEITTVLVVPCFQQTGKNLIDFEHRFKMCQSNFGWLPKVVISRIEQEIGEESLTYRTISVLMQIYPDATLRFVMGSDLVESAPTWEGWNAVLTYARPLIVGRAGIQSPNNPSPISPAVSSSLVRSALEARNYAAVERYLARDVLNYIRQESLYV
jgi:nicotinate-nucleotide adenylyltransferase